MIHHVSIAARNPRHVAAVLAEVLGGEAFEFPPTPGSFVALAGDDHGTAIEVYPLGTELSPGTGPARPWTPQDGVAPMPYEVQMRGGFPAHPWTATHVAVASPLSEAAVHALARREGWRAVTCDRGPAFQVVELWLENRQLIEVLAPSMVARYLAFLTPAAWRAAFGLEPVRVAAPEAVEAG